MTDRNWQLAQQTELLNMLGGRLDFPVDERLRYLLDHFPCERLHAVELGCWHGWHTAALARCFQRVTAVDVRPDNVAKTLLRLNLLNLQNVEVKLAHVDNLIADCDVLIHIGVLYHLSDPVAHLHRVLSHCSILCLDTHINRPGLSPAVEHYLGERYHGGLYREGGWHDPLSGVDATSLWLDETELRRVLINLGFIIIHYYHHQVIPGPRLSLVAIRTLFA